MSVIDLLSDWIKSQKIKGPQIKDAPTFYRNLEEALDLRRADHSMFTNHKSAWKLATSIDFCSNDMLAPRTTSDGKPFFVSDGDVLYAWWTCVVFRAENPSPDRMVNMRSTYCCRSLLADLGHIPSATSALVTNAVSSTLTFLSVRQVLERPLGFTASAIREALLQQRNEEQFQAYDAIKRDTLDKVIQHRKEIRILNNGRV